MKHQKRPTMNQVSRRPLPTPRLVKVVERKKVRVIDLLAHASLDAKSEVLCHEASLNGLYAHSLEVLSKCGQILVICWERDCNR